MRVLTTTDHKVIGKLYLVHVVRWFMVGGVMAMLMRSELAYPGQQVVNEELYNQLFTMHGTIMLLLFATPLFFGFANAIMPLQIGSPDVAFPRLNMFSYWLFLFGGLIAASGFLTPQGAASFGWFAYAPLNDAVRSPSVGGDLWVMGLWLAGLGTILGAVNLITTIICMRAPGMTMFRMPIFVWNTLVTSLLVLIAFPVLAGALLMLEADRQLGCSRLRRGPRRRDPVAAPVLVLRPSGGLHHRAAVLRHRDRDPAGLQPQTGLRLHRPGRRHDSAIAILSVAVWAHHMFVTGAVDLPFFSGMSFLIAVPTGIKFFNWIGTMWGGSLSFDTPMLWSIGFLTTFLFGGLTGIILASPPLDFHVSDSYFVVAHFHYVVFGTVVFAMFAGFYFWWPKITGRMLDERLGKVHFWLLFVGFHTHLPGAALAGRRGHVAAHRRLPAPGRLHHAQPGLDDRRVPARRLDAAVPLQRLDLAQGAQGRGGRPVGLGPLAGVGDVLPAAAAQLRHHPADPLGVAGLRPAPPGDRSHRAQTERSRGRGPGSRRARPGGPRGIGRANGCGPGRWRPIHAVGRGTHMTYEARITSSVVFVSEVSRSVDYYREVFSCTASIENQSAALVVTPAGFQIYLIAKGDRASHPLGGIGYQCLIWTVGTAAELDDLEQVMRDRGHYTYSRTTGDVRFLSTRDPDGIRILVAHPSPEELPRSVVDAVLYV